MRRLISGVVFSLAIMTAHAEQSPLLELTNKLHCAGTEQEAAAVLLKLSSLSVQPFGIPSDTLSNNDKSLLYAASVDILLKVLYDTIQHYPALQESAERTALRWNYCEIMTRNGIADLFVAGDGDIIQRQATDSFPEQKKGFRIWGFLKPDPDNRYVPQLIQNMEAFPRAHQELVFRLYQQQCFPHPETGDLYNEPSSSTPPQFGSRETNQVVEQSKNYPYFWRADCSETIVPNKPIGQIAATKPIKTEPKKTAIKSTSANNGSEMVSNLTAPIIEPAPELKSEPENAKSVERKKEKSPTKAIEKQHAKKTEESKQGAMDLSLASIENYAPPEKDDLPIMSPAIAGENSNAGAMLPLPPKDGLGLAGNFYNRSKLTGAQSVGANVGWRPISNFFIRGGANYSYYPDKGKFSYAWGIGYDDWHPGTISVQLNNWGPILPSEGLALKKAVANIGYKFEALALRPYSIAGSAGVNLPIDGSPGIVTTWSWMPIENWFVRASLQKKFGKDDGLSWTYSFGYFDWHPFTFSLTYDNYGVNPIFDSKSLDAFNFQENGAVSLSWSWAF